MSFPGTRSPRFAPAFVLTAGFALSAAALTGCSSSDDDPVNPGGGAVALETLSGNVRGAGGTGLVDVNVTVGTNSTVTNANGDFVITSLGSISSGEVLVEFDGSSAGAGSELYSTLDVLVSLPSGTTNLVMPQVITLPDLNSAGSDSDTVTVTAGATDAAIALANGTSNVGLDGPMGTLITIDGVLAATPVDINITPVQPEAVPMPLPDDLIGGSFVTIQPSNAAFAPPAAAGLDVTLPNSLNLPDGTMVDIWSFDHDVNAWVNRSAETGNQGVVSVGGADIVALGVITEGGWHAPVLPVRPECATVATGRVIDSVNMEAIPGANIAFSTGQFTTSDSNGDFTLPDLVAYDVNDLMNCTAVDVDYEVVLPPSFGSTSQTGTLAMANVVIGGTSDLSNITFTISTTGSVAGIISGDGAGDVLLTEDAGSGTAMATPNSDGSFFIDGLAEGAWTATFQFDGLAFPTENTFTVVANQIATVNLQAAVGQGTDDITIFVVEDDDDDTTPLMPVQGAVVLLQGSDAGSSNGFVMTTDMNGMATFNDVSGPYTVTAQLDNLEGSTTTRHASSLVGITPTSSTIAVPLLIEPVENVPIPSDSLTGIVSNMPAIMGTETLEVFAVATNFGFDVFSGNAMVDNMGNYTMSVPPGVELDAWVVHRDNLATSRIISTLFVPGIGQTSGGTLAANFDFANAVAWDQPVNVTFANVGADVDTDVYFEAFDLAAGTAFDGLIYSGSIANVTLNLPDVTDMAFTGLNFNVFAGVNPGTLSESECEFVLSSTPTDLDFDFLSPPTPVTPADSADFTAEEFGNLTVSFTGAANGSFGANGFNAYFFESISGPTPSGIDVAQWEIFFPSNASSFDIPLAALPMFVDGQTLEGGIDKQLFAGSTVNFNTFFNENVNQNLEDLRSDATSTCEVESFYSFTLSNN